ncbi:hypothetical protein BTI_3698 [Burkholderia thailandensis MSMB121]|nr:hypothetical protein BTI_3698 [Burkholderia thailandensis MSMB121]ATF32672.1 hypothetical protein CO709_04220 [Burkholderia thailandensis]KST71147.1 hypothetical protein WS76_21390 [Burkholderia humptydooensis]
MRNSYNDFCYRQRENCEAGRRGERRMCAHAQPAGPTSAEKRQSNQCDAMYARASRDAGFERGCWCAARAARRPQYRYAQNFVGST